MSAVMQCYWYPGGIETDSRPISAFWFSLQEGEMGEERGTPLDLSSSAGNILGESRDINWNSEDTPLDLSVKIIQNHFGIGSEEQEYSATASKVHSKDSENGQSQHCHGLNGDRNTVIRQECSPTTTLIISPSPWRYPYEQYHGQNGFHYPEPTVASGPYPRGVSQDTNRGYDLIGYLYGDHYPRLSDYQSAKSSDNSPFSHVTVKQEPMDHVDVTDDVAPMDSYYRMSVRRPSMAAGDCAITCQPDSPVSVVTDTTHLAGAIVTPHSPIAPVTPGQTPSSVDTCFRSRQSRPEDSNSEHPRLSPTRAANTSPLKTRATWRSANGCGYGLSRYGKLVSPYGVEARGNVDNTDQLSQLGRLLHISRSSSGFPDPLSQPHPSVCRLSSRKCVTVNSTGLCGGTVSVANLSRSGDVKPILDFLEVQNKS